MHVAWAGCESRILLPLSLRAGVACKGFVVVDFSFGFVFFLFNCFSRVTFSPMRIGKTLH